jgi:hypothetical protein
LIDRCPHCQQQIPQPPKLVRTCYDCRKPIARHDKWKWDQRAGVLTSVHRHCDNPDSYQPPGQETASPAAPLFDEAAA